MRTLIHVDEFMSESSNAIFTKQQAVTVTLQLLDKERTRAGNSAEETAIFENAIKKAEFSYIDATKTETDRMLDSLGVARFTKEDIVKAISAILFDVQ